MKILHTADIHLGAKFKGVTNPSQFRRQLQDTFTKIIDLAISQNVDLLLIAGDLFDSSRPAVELINFVANQLQRLQKPIFIVPGTHDNNLYNNENIFTHIPQLTIFTTNEWTGKEILELNTTVYGIAPSEQYPLRSLRPQTNSRYHLALLHAGFYIPEKIQDEHLVTAEDISSSGMNYLALGHWHKLSDYTQGKVAAWYPGSPEPLTIDSTGAGNVIIVDIDKMQVQPYLVGITKCEELEIDVSDIEDITEIKGRINSAASPNLRRSIRLKGFSMVKLDDIAAELASGFGQLRIINDTHIPPEKLNPQEYQHQPFAKKFLELMQAEIAARSGPDRQIAAKARDYGISLLEGKDIL